MHLKTHELRLALQKDGLGPSILSKKKTVWMLECMHFQNQQGNSFSLINKLMDLKLYSKKKKKKLASDISIHALSKTGNRNPEKHLALDTLPIFPKERDSPCAYHLHYSSNQRHVNMCFSS